MYTLTFGTPTVGASSATLPFTLDGTVSDGPYVGTASATGGGETKTGDVTVDANSATGEIVFTGLSAGTTYTIAQGEIDITYGGNDQSLAHGGISFITKATGYDTPMAATQEQWEDLAARVKAKSDVQITMTNTDPGEGSALPANNYVAVYGGDPIIMDYSTSEINTGAKWIDGSAIYKKTISVGALPNSTTKNTAHNISNLGQVLRIEGFTTNGTNTYELPRVMIGGTQYQAQIQVNSTNIQIDTGDDLSSYTTTYVTLYYTKSSS